MIDSLQVLGDDLLQHGVLGIQGHDPFHASG